METESKIEETTKTDHPVALAASAVAEPPKKKAKASKPKSEPKPTAKSEKKLDDAKKKHVRAALEREVKAKKSKPAPKKAKNVKKAQAAKPKKSAGPRVSSLVSQAAAGEREQVFKIPSAVLLPYLKKGTTIPELIKKLKKPRALISRSIVRVAREEKRKLKAVQLESPAHSKRGQKPFLIRFA